MRRGGGAATAISNGVLNPQHNFEKILRPGPGREENFSLDELLDRVQESAVERT